RTVPRSHHRGYAAGEDKSGCRLAVPSDWRLRFAPQPRLRPISSETLVSRSEAYRVLLYALVNFQPSRYSRDKYWFASATLVNFIFSRSQASAGAQRFSLKILRP